MDASEHIFRDMITGHWKYIKMFSKREKQAPTMYRVSQKTG